ncbi:MAG: UTP--glucose-1-phosphate uridylyltransferase [Clostridia bacterium]|nr:UTP--glucose-1-phosphate uridylyltransferase [Clostridia bacterium]
MNYLEKLKKYNQNHLLKFENELSEEEKAALHKQIEELDFSYLEQLCIKNSKEEKIVVSPIKAMTLDQIKLDKEKYERIGLEALKNGEVAALLLAGGMGTRLGSDKPKGMYNIGKTKDVYIFQRLFENLLEVVEKCGKPVPFFIMTSEKNDKDTRDFLESKNYFGYDKNYVKFFVQEMAPCVSLDGKILLEEKGKIATSPNGNGGWFSDLMKNEETREFLEKSNVKWINFFAVDNVLQRIADPVFIGATLDGGYQVGAKTIRKVDPYEKVGVMCKKNGRPSVIEYIDLTEEMAHQTDEDGERVYNFGVILNYIFNLNLLKEIKDKKIPVHVVTKKVECIDEEGMAVKPEQPNAHKFEMLNVDLVEFADSCLTFEVEREKEFAPIKNKTGVDSVESAQALLEKNGYVL